jgi:hypothetical protein
MIAVCCACGASRTTKGERIPAGWKRVPAGIFCDKCWGESHVLRAVTIPVASPLDHDWTEFRALLRSMFAVTTQAYNWTMTELYARDIRREADAKKMPAMAKVYLYPVLRARFPTLPPQAVVALEHAAQGKYRKKRYEVIWTCASSLPTYRYPTPFPVHNQSWSIVIEDQCPIVTARIGATNTRFRLRGGAKFRRQLDAVKLLVGGEAIPGQLDIFERGKDLMCKMVAWLPRTAAKTGRTDTLFVRTDTAAMIVALNAKDDTLWTYHGDQIPRWAAEHRKQLQNWADDSKAEHRPTPPFFERRHQAALKYRARTKSALQQIAAMTVGYAKRRKFAAISYDDSLTAFAPQFPWFELRATLAQLADASGIEFEYAGASGEAAKESPQPLGLE